MHFWLMVAIVDVAGRWWTVVRQAAIAQLNCMQRENIVGHAPHTLHSTLHTLHSTLAGWRQNNIICDQSNYFALVYSIITASTTRLGIAWPTLWLADCSTTNSIRGWALSV